MRKKGLIILLFIVIIVSTVIYLFLKPAFSYLSGYLSKSEHISANILLVEGWLPDYALDMSLNEFQTGHYEYIITTGLKSVTDYCQVSMNGYLKFYMPVQLKELSKTASHIIEIDAFSEMEGAYSAHLNLFINGSKISDFIVGTQKKKYGSVWEGSLSDIDSIMIQLTNDRLDEGGDVNLYVKEVIIDRNIKIPFLNNSVYDIDSVYGKKRIINNFSSCAETARNRLLSLGIDSSRIIAVPGEEVFANRTLTSALSFRNWLKATSIKVKGINIMSMGTHARRTWMTYNRILNEQYDIGITALPDYENNNSEKSNMSTTIRETLGIIYYWIILIPY
jgi:hypothetical protein